MLDLTTPRGRILDAALRLAAERPWSEVTLHDIAEAAGVTLAAFRAEFSSKSAVVAAFIRAVDDEVLLKAGRPDQTQAPRDRLFEVMMARFDALQPFKAGLASITNATTPDPTLAGKILNSQRWMLEAAGIGAEGVAGGFKATGLASVYASVFRVWLEDDDPGLARTMAALDRRLRRGENAVSAFDDMCKGVERIGDMIRSSVMRTRDRRAGSDTAHAPEPSSMAAGNPAGGSPSGF